MLNHFLSGATDLVLTTCSLEIFLKMSTRDGEPVWSELSQCRASGPPGEWSVFLQTDKDVRLNRNVQNLRPSCPKLGRLQTDPQVCLGHSLLGLCDPLPAPPPPSHTFCALFHCLSLKRLIYASAQKKTSALFSYGYKVAI